MNAQAFHTNVLQVGDSQILDQYGPISPQTSDTDEVLQMPETVLIKEDLPPDFLDEVVSLESLEEPMPAPPPPPPPSMPCPLPRLVLRPFASLCYSSPPPPAPPSLAASTPWRVQEDDDDDRRRRQPQPPPPPQPQPPPSPPPPPPPQPQPLQEQNAVAGRQEQPLRTYSRLPLPLSFAPSVPLECPSSYAPSTDSRGNRVYQATAPAHTHIHQQQQQPMSVAGYLVSPAAAIPTAGGYVVPADSDIRAVIVQHQQQQQQPFLPPPPPPYDAPHYTTTPSNEGAGRPQLLSSRDGRCLFVLRQNNAAPLVEQEPPQSSRHSYVAVLNPSPPPLQQVGFAQLVPAVGRVLPPRSNVTSAQAAAFPRQVSVQERMQTGIAAPPNAVVVNNRTHQEPNVSHANPITRVVVSASAPQCGGGGGGGVPYSSNVLVNQQQAAAQLTLHVPNALNSRSNPVTRIIVPPSMASAELLRQRRRPQSSLVSVDDTQEPSSSSSSSPSSLQDRNASAPEEAMQVPPPPPTARTRTRPQVVEVQASHLEEMVRERAQVVVPDSVKKRKERPQPTVVQQQQQQQQDASGRGGGRTGAVQQQQQQQREAYDSTSSSSSAPPPPPATARPATTTTTTTTTVPGAETTAVQGRRRQQRQQGRRPPRKQSPAETVRQMGATAAAAAAREGSRAEAEEEAEAGGAPPPPPPPIGASEVNGAAAAAAANLRLSQLLNWSRTHRDQLKRRAEERDEETAVVCLGESPAAEANSDQRTKRQSVIARAVGRPSVVVVAGAGAERKKKKEKEKSSSESAPPPPPPQLVDLTDSAAPPIIDLTDGDQTEEQSGKKPSDPQGVVTLPPEEPPSPPTTASSPRSPQRRVMPPPLNDDYDDDDDDVAVVEPPSASPSPLPLPPPPAIPLPPPPANPLPPPPPANPLPPPPPPANPLPPPPPAEPPKPKQKPAVAAVRPRVSRRKQTLLPNEEEPLQQQQQQQVVVVPQSRRPQELLSPLQETQLLFELTDLAKSFDGLSVEEVVRITKEFLDGEKSSAPEAQNVTSKEVLIIVHRLLKRNLRLRAATYQYNRKQRRSDQNALQAAAHARLEMAVRRGRFDPSQVFTVDAEPLCYVAARATEVHLSEDAPTSSVVSVLTAVSAIGWTSSPLLVIAGENAPDVPLRAAQGDGVRGAMYAQSRDGRVTTMLFQGWLRRFLEFMHCSRQKPLLLLLVDHPACKNLNVLRLCRTHGVVVVGLPRGIIQVSPLLPASTRTMLNCMRYAFNHILLDSRGNCSDFMGSKCLPLELRPEELACYFKMAFTNTLRRLGYVWGGSPRGEEATYLSRLKLVKALPNSPDQMLNIQIFMGSLPLRQATASEPSDLDRPQHRGVERNQPEELPPSAEQVQSGQQDGKKSFQDELNEKKKRTVEVLKLVGEEKRRRIREAKVRMQAKKVEWVNKFGNGLQSQTTNQELHTSGKKDEVQDEKALVRQRKKKASQETVESSHIVGTDSSKDGIHNQNTDLQQSAEEIFDASVQQMEKTLSAQLQRMKVLDAMRASQNDKSIKVKNLHDMECGGKQPHQTSPSQPEQPEQNVSDSQQQQITTDIGTHQGPELSVNIEPHALLQPQQCEKPFVTMPLAMGNSTRKESEKNNKETCTVSQVVEESGLQPDANRCLSSCDDERDKSAAPEFIDISELSYLETRIVEVQPNRFNIVKVLRIPEPPLDKARELTRGKSIVDSPSPSNQSVCVPSQSRLSGEGTRTTWSVSAAPATEQPLERRVEEVPSPLTNSHLPLPPQPDKDLNHSSGSACIEETVLRPNSSKVNRDSLSGTGDKSFERPLEQRTRTQIPRVAIVAPQGVQPQESSNINLSPQGKCGIKSPVDSAYPPSESTPLPPSVIEGKTVEGQEKPVVKAFPDSWGCDDNQDDKSRIQKILWGEVITLEDSDTEVETCYSAVCVKDEMAVKEESKDSQNSSPEQSRVSLFLPLIPKRDSACECSSNPNSEETFTLSTEMSNSSALNDEVSLLESTVSGDVTPDPNVPLSVEDSAKTVQYKNRSRKSTNPRKRTNNIVLTKFHSDKCSPKKKSKTEQQGNKIFNLNYVSKPQPSVLRIKPVVLLERLPDKILRLFDSSNKRPSKKEIVRVVKCLMQKLEPSDQFSKKRKQEPSDKTGGKKKRCVADEDVELSCCESTSTVAQELPTSSFTQHHRGKTTVCANPPVCIYCGDFGPGDEIWVNCVKCFGWAHADCSGAVKSKFECDYCVHSDR